MNIFVTEQTQFNIKLLRHRLWMTQLRRFLQYICCYIPRIRTNTRQSSTFTSFSCRKEFFQNSFIECHKRMEHFDPHMQSFISYNGFCKALLTFIRTDLVGIKLLTRLRIGFRHLYKHKFCHNFEHTVNPLCSCI